MSKLSSSDRRRGRGLVLVLLSLVVVAFAFGMWGALRLGPAPAVVIEVDRPAVGRSAKVTATFSEPGRGLGRVRLELVQGTHTVVLGERSFARAGAFNPLRGPATGEATVEATIGRATQEWLAEGEAVLRATADRMSGPLRMAAPVVVEKRVAVRLRPPRLELLSRQHYVRQGGAGAVVFRTGDTAVRSGVRAGGFESVSFPLPGAAAGERFALFAIPWELADGRDIRVFAEDDAGNRAEAPFVDLFKPIPAKSDTIEVSDAFLEKVVPPIVAQTPELDPSGSLLDQYVRINSDLRAKILARVAGLAATTEPRFLWSGPFLQMPNTEKRANFAETRSYTYQGRVVDRQTHLGLDLASNARAPVPAANAGRVLFAGWLGIYGNAVILDHGYGLLSLYGHLSAVSVGEGERVARGATVGNSGATGLAGGDHLHLEIFLQGKSVDPVEWLDAHWITDNIASKLPVTTTP
jgi:murein DD-endopeptidase MepM/ murein hydrolase activator NlpD